MTSRTISRSLLSLATFALCGSIAMAQQPPAPPTPPAASPDAAAAPIERQPPSDTATPPKMHPGMMQAQRRLGEKLHRTEMNSPDKGHDGFRIAPDGIWWKNPMVVQKLALTPDQVKRMDDIFQKSRIELIDLKANLEKQNAYLEPLLSANPPDTTKALAQIDKIAQARAELEKAHARMLLGIRGVLTPDQWTKLNAHRGPDGFGGPEGAGAPGGFGPGGHGGFGPGHGPNNFVEPEPMQ